MINSRPRGTFLVLAIALMICTQARSQQTVGLFTNENPQGGLVLFGPNAATKASFLCGATTKIVTSSCP